MIDNNWKTHNIVSIVSCIAHIISWHCLQNTQKGNCSDKCYCTSTLKNTMCNCLKCLSKFYMGMNTIDKYLNCLARMFQRDTRIDIEIDTSTLWRYIKCKEYFNTDNWDNWHYSFHNEEFANQHTTPWYWQLTIDKSQHRNWLYWAETQHYKKYNAARQCIKDTSQHRIGMFLFYFSHNICTDTLLYTSYFAWESIHSHRISNIADPNM